MARAVAPRGRVVGLDLALGNLVATPVSRDPWWLPGRVVRVNGTLQALPFRDSSFDWVWSADTLWPDAVEGDPVEAVRELARVVRRRGTIALLFWSGQSLLPGYPQLEARLGVAFAEHTPCLTGLTPLQHHLRALAWLQEAGLEQVRARTFVAEVAAPLAPGVREALAGCFEMLWGDLLPYLRTGDRRAYRRLCWPNSSECILDHPGYHALVTYTLFAADTPGS
jgi:demethylmenaquinone methyltransferase/2-methoxy-6-polyprenyl-1,4-benzoquinol methylase